MPSNWVRSAGRDVVGQAIEALRAALFFAVGAAARALPRAWAFGLARGASLALAITPIGARARRDMRSVFPGQRAAADRYAVNWLHRPFRDHVTATRIAGSLERTADWTVEMRGKPAMLDDPDQSLIIATGHFSREAMTAIYMPWVIRHRLATVIAPMTRARTPRGLRVRLQMREMVKGIRAVRKGEVDIIEVAGRSFLVRLLHHLREPGGVVVIASDATWGGDKGSGLTRSFAGFASQAFAIGTARLARLSQRPIVACVPFMDGDARVVMEWGPVIAPPARDDATADARITNEILDWIERRIGERPDQYVLSFGSDRRWNSLTRTWTGGEQPDLRIEAPTPSSVMANES